MYAAKNAIHYYYAKILETNHPYYWFCLAEEQYRTGLFHQALQTIDKALLFPNHFPSKCKLIEMQRNIRSLLQREDSQEETLILFERQGDIDGDGIADKVFLIGTKTPESPLWRDIRLVVQNGKNQHSEEIQLNNNMGYNPTLFLGDFTGDKVDDILVVIDTGGSAGTIYTYIFSTINGQLRQVFNSDVFNQAYKYNVTYENQYKATIVNLKLNEKYILDLAYKGKDYLDELYTVDGILKTPINGWVNPLSGLYPVDFNRDGIYELEAYQRIAGRYNADGLGYVLSVLKWNGHGFDLERQNVAIFGGSNTINT